MKMRSRRRLRASEAQRSRNDKKIDREMKPRKGCKLKRSGAGRSYGEMFFGSVVRQY